MCRSLSKALAKVFEGVSSTNGSRLFRRDRLTGGSDFLVFFGTSSWNNVRFVFFSASVEIRRDRRGASELSDPEDGTRLRFAGFTSGSDSSLKIVYFFCRRKKTNLAHEFYPSLAQVYLSSSVDIDIASSTFFVDTLRGDFTGEIGFSVALSSFVDWIGVKSLYPRVVGKYELESR